jgi:hypothetical protein
MNETLMSRIGKLFFPRLAPDQRHHRMTIVLLVVLTSIVSVSVLFMWMMSTRGINVIASPSLPSALK